MQTGSKLPAQEDEAVFERNAVASGWSCILASCSQFYAGQHMVAALTVVVAPSDAERQGSIHAKPRHIHRLEPS